ncbi:MAG: hypothetical protein JNJ71_17660 [Rubrivivax sp.]|nr:hypothetical protein [Rubrivivax sp.]
MPPPVAATTIVTQPASVAVNDGQTAAFSVAASGAGLSYQWRRNGTAIDGATGASWVTGALAPADSGARFSVVVSGTAGSVTSSDAVLTVNALAPVISVAPAAVSVTAGQAASFSVSAAGSAPLSYQWLRAGVAIAGATSSSYTTGLLSTADNGAQISVRVSNAAGSVTSAAAGLSVTAAALAPVIATQPANVTVAAGTSATFSVAIGAGTAPFSYQWLRNGTDIPGANASSYTTGTLSASDTGASFQVRVSNAAGPVSSNSALLTVSVPPTPSASTQRLAIGGYRVIAIRADGSVLNWGVNTAGQLGGGAAIAGTSARQVAGTATAAAAGQWESLVLGTDGVVRGWGRSFGPTSIIGGAVAQMGTDRPDPVASAFPSGITQVSTAWGGLAVALRNDGTVWHLPGTATAAAGMSFTQVALQVPGLGNVVRLGRDPESEPFAITTDGTLFEIQVLASGPTSRQATAVRQTAVTNVASATCMLGVIPGPNYGCIALLRDGTVRGFSRNSAASTAITGISDVVAITGTSGSFHAITRDGRLWSWGSGEQSGIAGPENNRYEMPTVVPGLTGVQEVVANLGTVIVRLADGSVWAFGSNDFGVFGDATQTRSRTPVRVPGVNLN